MRCRGTSSLLQGTVWLVRDAALAFLTRRINNSCLSEETREGPGDKRVNLLLGHGAFAGSGSAHHVAVVSALTVK